MSNLQCPRCQTPLKLSVTIPPGRSATVTCSNCAHVFKATADGAVQQAATLAPFANPAGRTSFVPPQAAAATVTITDPFPSDEAPTKSGVRSKGNRSGEIETKSRPRSPELDEEAPLPNGKSSRILWIASLGGVLALGLGLGAGVLVFGSSKGKVPNEQQIAKGGDIGKPTSPNMDVLKKEKPDKESNKPQKNDNHDKNDKVETELTGGGFLERQELAGDAVYDRMIRGCVFILAIDHRGSIASGTGWVADAERKIVVTAHHVIENAESIFVYLPRYDPAGRPVTSWEEYLGAKINGKYEKKGLNASLIRPAEGLTKDLAILQVEGELPAKTRAIPLASNETKAGQQVYSVGSSGVNSGILWRFLPGTVSTDPVLKKYLSYHAYICEIKSQNNPGDSGGPIVNNKVEVVGLVSAGSKVENSIITAVDVREIRALLKSTYQRKGWEWKDQHGAGGIAGGSLPKTALQAWIRQLKTSKRPDEIKEAARKLGELQEDAQVAVPDLIDVLLKSSDTQVQEIVFAALEAIKKPANLDRILYMQVLKSTHLLAQTYVIGLLRNEKANREEYIEVLDLAKKTHQKILDGKEESNRELAADRELLARSFGVFEKYGLECKQDVIDMLFIALEDTDPGLRQAAGNTVASFINETRRIDPKDSPFDKEKDTPRLKAALESSKNANLRRVAALAYQVMPDSPNEAFAFYTVPLLSAEKDPEVITLMVAGLTERWSKDRGIERYRETINKLSDHGYRSVKLAFVKAAAKMPWHKSTNDRLISMINSTEIEDEVKIAAFNTVIRKLEVTTGGTDLDREQAEEQLRLVIALLSSKEREKQLEELWTRTEQNMKTKTNTLSAPLDEKKKQEMVEREKELEKEVSSDFENFRRIQSRRNLETKQLVEKLAKFGPAAGNATSDLVALLKSRNSYLVRIEVLKTLRSIGKDAAKHSIEAIQELLAPKVNVKTLNYDRIEEAVELHLDRFAANKNSTFEQAVKETQEKYGMQLGAEAVATLASFGEAGMEPLIAALKNKTLPDLILSRICLAIADLGPIAQTKAMPILLSMAEKDPPNLRDALTKAMSKLGGEELATWLLAQNITKKATPQRQMWAYEIMSELNLETIATKEQLMNDMEGRLKAASESHPNKECKQTAKDSLRKLRENRSNLKKTSTLEGKK